jgi:spore coat polysaccharide biosynthesis protein SpsF
MNKTHIIIQARMGSTRLPGKVLMDLSGDPLLSHVVARCKKAQRADDVIIATSDDNADDMIAQFCQKQNINYFRGSQDNVLERYLKTAQFFESDHIVRVTADCPLIDPQVIDWCIDGYYRARESDYLSNILTRTFPRGLDVEVFSLRALQRAFEQAEEKYEQEHVTPFIWENKDNEFIVADPIEAPDEYARNYRLTVDYSEDFELMEKIYEALHKQGEIVDAKDAIQYLDENPEVASINAHCEQKSYNI